MKALFSSPMEVFFAMFAFMGICVYVIPRIRYTRQFPSVLVVLIGSMVLANTGIMPAKSPVYDVLYTPALLMCITGYMMTVDVRDLVKVGPMALLVFGIGVVGIIAGTAIATPIVARALGKEQAAMVAGLIGATWIGGHSNFGAISAAIKVPDSFAPIVLGINMVIANTHFAIMMFLTGSATKRINNWMKPRHDLEYYFPQIELKKPRLAAKGQDLLVALGLAALIALVSWRFGSLIQSVVPSADTLLLAIIALSIIGLVVGRYLKTEQTFPGANLVGECFLYLFLMIMGLKAASPAALLKAPAVAYQLLIIMVVYMTILIIGARLVRAPFELTNVTANAQVGSVGTGVPCASAYRQSFIPTGVLLAVLGNVVGNYIGLLMYFILR